MPKVSIDKNAEIDVGKKQEMREDFSLNVDVRDFGKLLFIPFIVSKQHMTVLCDGAYAPIQLSRLVQSTIFPLQSKKSTLK